MKAIDVWLVENISGVDRFMYSFDNFGEWIDAHVLYHDECIGRW